MGMLEDGVKWALRHVNQTESEPCRYVQGGVSYDLDLVPALETTEHLTDVGSVIINSRRQDFLAIRQDFQSIVPDLPDRGDLIYRTVAGEEIEYEVTSDGSDPCYRFQSRYRYGLRIHAQRTALNVVGT